MGEGFVIIKTELIVRDQNSELDGVTGGGVGNTRNCGDGELLEIHIYLSGLQSFGQLRVVFVYLYFQSLISFLGVALCIFNGDSGRFAVFGEVGIGGIVGSCAKDEGSGGADLVGGYESVPIFSGVFNKAPAEL